MHGWCENIWSSKGPQCPADSSWNLGHPWWNVWNILSFWRCCKKWCPRRKWGYFKASLDFVVSDSIGNCQSDNFLLDFLMYQLHLHKEPTGNKDLIPVLLIEATCACCLYRIYISSMPKVINKNNIWLTVFLGTCQWNCSGSLDSD